MYDSIMGILPWIVLISIISRSILVPCSTGKLIQILTDGIRITKGHDLAIEEGLWTLLISITEPGSDYRTGQRSSLLLQVGVLEAYIAQEPLTPILTEARRQHQTP